MNCAGREDAMALAREIRSDDRGVHGRPTIVQRRWLMKGIDQPGGKLPLFDEVGREIDPRTIRSCIRQGWAEPWITNPIKPDWLVCRLTEAGRSILV